MSKREKRAGKEQSVHAEETEGTEEGTDNGVGAEDQQAPEAERQTEETAEQSVDESTDVNQLKQRIQELEAEVKDLKDQYLRKQADFENFRKRKRREQEEAVEYANQELLLDLTSIIDDFERAIKSAGESRDFDSFHDGVVMIEKQFTGLLERKWGLKRFESEGEEFDPQKHEAVATEGSDEHDTPVVVEDYQRGYFLNDRVLRTAKVKVSMPSGQSSQSSSGPQSSGGAQSSNADDPESGGTVDTEA
jgi:molecular chaperone GrpE